MNEQPISGAPAEEIKTCCANVYESDWARLLLGDSFHPGGPELTHRLGVLLGLGPGVRVLDVASGKGTSALYLAEQFGCEVVGLDYGAENVAVASRTANDQALSGQVSFRQGDAERLPFEDASFDAVISECAYCTFPDKAQAALEFHRVLRPGGRVGISDLTLSGPPPEGLESLLAWVACLGDARPVDEYVRYLEEAGFEALTIEQHDGALVQMVRDVRGRLLGAEVLVRLRKLDLPGVDFGAAKSMAQAAASAVAAGSFGYALIVAARPST